VAYKDIAFKVPDGGKTPLFKNKFRIITDNIGCVFRFRWPAVDFHKILSIGLRNIIHIEKLSQSIKIQILPPENLTVI
jgi:hypothetical protein